MVQCETRARSPLRRTTRAESAEGMSARNTWPRVRTTCGNSFAFSDSQSVHWGTPRAQTPRPLVCSLLPIRQYESHPVPRQGPDGAEILDDQPRDIVEADRQQAKRVGEPLPESGGDAANRRRRVD